MTLEVYLPPVRRALIVAPHPDDETIAAFGLIRALVRSKAAVRVCVVTDGAASHPGSRKWPPARLAKARQREVVAAMALAGLGRGRITFLGWPDGELAALGPCARRDLVRQLGAGALPDLVVRPSEFDAHPDHAAVGRACRTAWPARVVHAVYRVWPAGQTLRGSHSCQLGTDRALKKAALRLFRTQTGRVDDDPAGFVIGPGLVQHFVRPTEAFALSR